MQNDKKQVVPTIRISQGEKTEKEQQGATGAVTAINTKIAEVNKTDNAPAEQTASDITVIVPVAVAFAAPSVPTAITLRNEATPFAK